MEEKPYHAFLKQSYLVNARYVNDLSERASLDDRTRARMRFFARQILDAVSPSNYLCHQSPGDPACDGDRRRQRVRYEKQDETSTIDPDEMLKSMVAQAVKQHEQIRTTIRDITLKALQMRDLSLEQINSVVRNITAGVNIGVGEGKTDTQKTLSNALA